MKKIFAALIFLIITACLFCGCEKEYVYVCTGCDKIKSSDEMAVHNQYGSDGIIRKGTCEICIEKRTELNKTIWKKIKSEGIESISRKYFKH